ncbi:hypothetical protein GALL_485150 [mine drainage metagenome]|uniref:Uncharacterized protein n=1 Tax=mine drainage metagenome TaxID=410659 RepID=A0A1J5PE22_9ZZZZ
MKVLRHHDVGEVLVDFPGGFFHVGDEIHHMALGHGGHRIFDDQTANAAGFGGNVVVLGLGLVNTVEDFFCGIARQAGNVGQTAFGIRQFAGPGFDFFG